MLELMLLPLDLRHRVFGKVLSLPAMINFAKASTKTADDMAKYFQPLVRLVKDCETDSIFNGYDVMNIRLTCNDDIDSPFNFNDAVFRGYLFDTNPTRMIVFPPRLICMIAAWIVNHSPVPVRQWTLLNPVVTETQWQMYIHEKQEPHWVYRVIKKHAYSTQADGPGVIGMQYVMKIEGVESIDYESIMYSMVMISNLNPFVIDEDDNDEGYVEPDLGQIYGCRFFIQVDPDININIRNPIDVPRITGELNEAMQDRVYVSPRFLFNPKLVIRILDRFLKNMEEGPLQTLQRAIEDESIDFPAFAKLLKELVDEDLSDSPLLATRDMFMYTQLDETEWTHLKALCGKHELFGKALFETRSMLADYVVFIFEHKYGIMVTNQDRTYYPWNFF